MSQRLINHTAEGTSIDTDATYYVSFHHELSPPRITIKWRWWEMVPRVSVQKWERVGMTLDSQEAALLLAEQGPEAPAWRILCKALTRNPNPLVNRMQLEEITGMCRQNPSPYVSTAVI
jgi:hypothetical protein